MYFSITERLKAIEIIIVESSGSVCSVCVCVFFASFIRFECDSIARHTIEY